MEKVLSVDQGHRLCLAVPNARKLTHSQQLFDVLSWNYKFSHAAGGRGSGNSEQTIRD